jgi:hypothetical protein
MKAERLLAKLQLQQEMEWEREEHERKRKAANPTVTLDLKVDQAISMIAHLRQKKDDIYAELEMRHQLKYEQASYMRALMELREANLTAEEREARAEETRRGQILYSKVCPELHPDWRQQENSNAEFYRRQCTPLTKTES